MKHTELYRWMTCPISLIPSYIRDYLSRRRQRKQAIILLEKSSVLRRADRTVRYALSQGKIDQIFPVLPGDKAYLKGMMR